MHPILTGDCPDPAIFREGDTFYLTFSSGPYYPGLPIYSSRDLEHWTLENYAVQEFDGKEIWAPDFFRYKDRYYMYFSGAGTNWVTWTEDLRGAWAKPVDLEIHGLIDPGHVVDEEGQRYLLLSGGHMVPLSEDGLSASGPVRKLLDPAAASRGAGLRRGVPGSAQYHQDKRVLLSFLCGRRNFWSGHFSSDHDGQGEEPGGPLGVFSL